MLYDLMDMLDGPNTHVCVWRDGELYIESETEPETATELTAAA